MISGARGCGCPPKSPSLFTYNYSPPCTPGSRVSAAYTTASDYSSKSLNRSKSTGRQPFENPGQKSSGFSKDDGQKCPCPRPGHENYHSMRGKCSACCEGVLPDSKVISKIAAGGKPYKEIEAIINDNRVVVRIQRESPESEWDPPCDCIGDDPGDAKRLGRLGGGGCESRGPSRCGENVAFRKVDNFRSGQLTRGENCRTVTVFPSPEIIASEVREEDDERVNKDKKSEKTETVRLVDLEENPNIFVLRIRQKSENLDRKNNIDLEFRTPRPWMNRPKPKSKPTPELPPPKPPSPPETGVKKKPPKAKGAGKKKKGKK